MSPLKRKTRVKARNPKRRKSEFARSYGPIGRVEFVQRLPCVVCDDLPSENAHIKNGGMGRKADYDQIVPLCFVHHDELDQCNGRADFEGTYRLDLDREAARVEREWQSYEANGKLREGW